jgi:hypothetical protein
LEGESALQFFPCEVAHCDISVAVIYILFLDSARPQGAPYSYFYLFLFIDLFEYESHGVEEDDCAYEGEDLYDGLEEEADAL